MARRIKQLERHAFGGSLKDRAVKYEGPSLFGELDEQAKLAVAKEVERVSKEVGVAAEKRRGEAIAQSKGRGRRPERYYIFGLPVQTKTVYPEGVDLAEYDMIGQDENNVLHFEPQRLWVEKTITPVLRRKGHRDSLSPETVQTPRPHSIIGGGHVGVDLLATLVDNMYNHHLLEYRQVKMFAEWGTADVDGRRLDTHHGQCALSPI